MSTVDSSGKQYAIGMSECQIAKEDIREDIGLKHETVDWPRASSQKNDPVDLFPTTLFVACIYLKYI